MRQLKPGSSNSEDIGRFVQQQQNFAKLGDLRSSESQQLDSAAAHQTRTAGPMLRHASGAHQYDALAFNSPRDSSSLSLLRAVGQPSQNRGHSSKRPDTADNKLRDNGSLPPSYPARHPQNPGRQLSSRGSEQDGNGQEHATAHQLSHRPLRQKEFESSYLPTTAVGLGNENVQQRARPRQDFVWPEKPDNSFHLYASASASQIRPREEYPSPVSEHFSAHPSHERAVPAKASLEEVSSSSRSKNSNAQSVAQNFISSKANRFKFQGSQSPYLSRLHQRGPVATSSAATHSAAHRVLVSAGPAVEELTTESELRSNRESQQAARALASEDFLEDFSAEAEGDPLAAIGSEGMSAEAQRVEELKARLMEAVMPDVHVVDTIEEARRVSQLLLNDYRHLEFACDTEVIITPPKIYQQLFQSVTAATLLTLSFTQQSCQHGFHTEE